MNAKEVLALTENELKILEEKNQVLQLKVSQLEVALDKAKKAELEASSIATAPHQESSPSAASPAPQTPQN